jgi:hypothetical protein
MFQIKVIEKLNKHIFVPSLVLKIRAVYEIMWKNFVQPARPQMAIRGMRIVS